MDIASHIQTLYEIQNASWRMIWYSRNSHPRFALLWTRRMLKLIKTHISDIHNLAMSAGTDSPDISVLISGINLINDAILQNNFVIAAECVESIVLPIIHAYLEALASCDNGSTPPAPERASIENSLITFIEKLNNSLNGNEKIMTIIIPCYNAEDDIGNILNDLIHQTIGINPLEIILVDDASTDGTLQVLESWHNDYPDNIKVIHFSENGRQGHARNVGIAAASTDYIMFLDADDSVKNNICESCLEVAEVTGVEVVSVDLVAHFEDGTYDSPEGYCGESERAVFVHNLDDRRRLWHEGLRGSTVGKLYRKNIFEKYDISYPEKLLYEDNYFGVLVTLTIESYYILDDVYYVWNMHSASSSHKMNNMSHFDRVDVLDMLLKELKKRGIYAELRPELDHWFLQIYYLATLHIAFTRFDYVPYEKMNDLTRRFRKNFPDIRASEQYASLEYKYQRDFVDFAFCDLTNEDWDSLRTQYLALVT